MGVWPGGSLWAGTAFVAVRSARSWVAMWNSRDSDVWGPCRWQVGHGHSSHLRRREQVASTLQVQRGGVFLGCFLIPKVGRCALKQLRFLSCSHGSSTCLRTGNGAGLQTMSWILPSLKSLAEIPGTSYKVCVSQGATAEQRALSLAFRLNWRAWDCWVWGDPVGCTSFVGQAEVQSASQTYAQKPR